VDGKLARKKGKEKKCNNDSSRKEYAFNDRHTFPIMPT
jgi:hypothetical protein